MTRRIRKTLPGVVLIPDLAAVIGALKSWRAHRRAGGVEAGSRARPGCAVELGHVHRDHAGTRLRSAVPRPTRVRVARSCRKALRRRWFVAGASVIFSACPRSSTASGSRCRGSGAPRPPATARSGVRAAAGCSGTKRLRSRRNGPRMAFWWWRLPIRRRRPPPRRSCCCMACCATPASGTGASAISRRGHRTRLRVVVWPAARVDRAVRRAARGEDRRDPRGDRRPQVRHRRPQHGRARRARVSAPLRRREGAPPRDDRHAAPRQRARVALFPGVCLAQMRPGSAWLAELNRDDSAVPPRPSCRSGRGTTRWSRRRRRRALEGAENVALTGIGHNALLGDPAGIRARRRGDRARRAAAAVATPAQPPSSARPRTAAAMRDPLANVGALSRATSESPA